MNVLKSVTLLLLLCGTIAEDQMIISTESGKIRGEKIFIDEKEVLAFTGIPYAMPPIDNLRFSPPQPISPWVGVFNATQVKDLCPGIISPSYLEEYTNEDCLRLNIYSLSTDSSKAVIVWIPDGSFIYGHSWGYKEADIGDILHDVVFVSISYRLNVFGFLDANIKEAPGIVGLMDQELALSWIHRNIKYFGGDPARITLFGHEAGAVSGSYHAVNSANKGFFKRVIMLNGNMLPPSKIIETNKTRSREEFINLARDLNCFENTSLREDDSLNILQCIKSKSVPELAEALKYKSFYPVLNGTYASLKESLEQLSSSAVDLMIGTDMGDETVSVEEVLFHNRLMGKNITRSKLISFFEKHFENFFPESMLPLFMHYINQSAVGKDVRTVLREFLRDYYTVCNNNDIASQFSMYNQSVYMYENTFFIRSERLPMFRYNTWSKGYRTTSLRILFRRFPIFRYNATREVKYMKSILMDTVVTFAKTGKPPKINNEEWRPFTTKDKAYAELNGSRSSIKRDLRKEFCSFLEPYLHDMRIS